MTYRRVSILALFHLLVTVAGAQEIRATSVLNSLVAGAPIILKITITNNGESPFQIDLGEDQKGNVLFKFENKIYNAADSIAKGGFILIGNKTIEPHRTFSYIALLDRWLRIDRAGEHTLALLIGEKGKEMECSFNLDVAGITPENVDFYIKELLDAGSKEQNVELKMAYHLAIGMLLARTNEAATVAKLKLEDYGDLKHEVMKAVKMEKSRLKAID